MNNKETTTKEKKYICSNNFCENPGDYLYNGKRFCFPHYLLAKKRGDEE